MTLAILEPLPEEWDPFVLQHPQGHLLQLSSWGMLKAAAGWSVQRFAVAGVGDDLSAYEAPEREGATAPLHAPPASSLPLLAGAQMLIRKRYALSVAYIPRGPLFSGHPEVDDLLLSALTRNAHRHRAVFLRIEPNMLESNPRADRHHSWLLLKGFQPTDPIQPRSTIQVDLSGDNLMGRFSKGHRADIRRAERQGVAVQVGTTGDLDTFYAIMLSTSERSHFGIHTKAYYRKAYEDFADRSLLLFGEKEGQVVSAHMVFADSRMGYYLYSGSTEPGLKSGANHLLQWHAIQWAAQRGCAKYDLWGIPDALGRAATIEHEPEERAALEEEAQADPLFGVYRFKKGFGGDIVRYLPAYDQVYLSPLYTLWQRRFR